MLNLLQKGEWQFIWIHQSQKVPVEPFAGDRGGEVSGALEIVDDSESEVEKGEQEVYLLSSNISNIFTHIYNVGILS